MINAYCKRINIGVSSSSHEKKKKKRGVRWQCNQWHIIMASMNANGSRPIVKAGIIAWRQEENGLSTTHNLFTRLPCQELPLLSTELVM